MTAQPDRATELDDEFCKSEKTETNFDLKASNDISLITHVMTELPSERARRTRRDRKAIEATSANNQDETQ